MVVCCLSSSVTLPAGGLGTQRGNAASGRAGWPPGVWMVSAPGSWAADTSRRASTVTSCQGDTLLIDGCFVMCV